MTRRLLLIALPALLLTLTFERVHADDPVSTSVSFNREIIRIVQRRCEPCHFSGGLAMSLSTYQSTKSWGRAIREELVEHRMPPAIVARGYGRYETDPSLTAREMAVFLAWLDGGMPRGSDADLPPRIEAGGENGDELEDPAGVRVALPAQTVPAREPLVVRRITIDAGAAAGRAVARVQFRPGNRRVLRGALVFAAPAGQAPTQWVGGWLPWQHAVVPPQGYAITLPPRGTLIVDLYYRGGDAEAVDRSAVDLSLAPAAAPHVDDLIIDAVPAPPHAGQAAGRAQGGRTLSQPTTIWALQPAVDPSIASMELRAERPDKSVNVLLWIPKASPDWPLALVMQQPVHLPAGSTLSLLVERDPSASHPPAARVWVSAVH